MSRVWRASATPEERPRGPANKGADYDRSKVRLRGLGTRYTCQSPEGDFVLSVAVASAAGHLTRENQNMELLAKRLIRDIRDFPREGIVFKDITPVLADPAAFREAIDRMTDYARSRGADMVVGIESRGFIFGAPLAVALGAGFVPVRKLGKLPGETIRAEYALEYGTNTVEMQKDAIKPGQRVLIADDLLATGGTCAAAARLIEQLGGEVVGTVFLVELGFLNGRAVLERYDIHSLIEF